MKGLQSDNKKAKAALEAAGQSLTELNPIRVAIGSKNVGNKERG